METEYQRRTDKEEGAAEEPGNVMYITNVRINLPSWMAHASSCWGLGKPHAEGMTRLPPTMLRKTSPETRGNAKKLQRQVTAAEG